MTPFEERRRDPAITQEAYQGYLTTTEYMFTDTTYVESRDQIKKVTNDLTCARRVSFSRIRSLVEDVWVRYSAGIPLMPLRERVKYIFQDLQRHNEAFPKDSFKLWEPDAYYFTMLLTSWTVLFNLPEYLNVLVAHISQDPKTARTASSIRCSAASAYLIFQGGRRSYCMKTPTASCMTPLRETRSTSKKI